MTDETPTRPIRPRLIATCRLCVDVHVTEGDRMLGVIGGFAKFPMPPAMWPDEKELRGAIADMFQLKPDSFDLELRAPTKEPEET